VQEQVKEFRWFCKNSADAKTDEVLGVHMIGARCADLIAEAVVASHV
jgi:dihydrolipoamide dehydrogenase